MFPDLENTKKQTPMFRRFVIDQGRPHEQVIDCDNYGNPIVSNHLIHNSNNNSQGNNIPHSFIGNTNTANPIDTNFANQGNAESPYIGDNDFICKNQHSSDSSPGP